MGIIISINMMIFRNFFLACIFISCSHKHVISNEIKNKCKITEQNLNILNLSSNPSDLSNIELKSFYETDFEYDILYHSLTEGSNEHVLERWFMNKEKQWSHIKIVNNVRIDNKVVYDKREVDILFKLVEPKSYLQFCGDCFGCNNYTLLIKKNQDLFKYSSNGFFLNNLEGSDRIKVAPYADIIRYFKS